MKELSDAETIEAIKVKERIEKWLGDYPTRKGVVVFWDDERLEFVDLANVSGLHAAEFATKYRDFVLKQVGLSDFLYEETTNPISTTEQER